MARRRSIFTTRDSRKETSGFSTNDSPSPSGTSKSGRFHNCFSAEPARVAAPAHTASSAAIGRRLLVAVALLPAQNDDVGDRVPGVVDADEQEENGGAADHEEEKRRTPRQADCGRHNGGIGHERQ